MSGMRSLSSQAKQEKDIPLQIGGQFNTVWVIASISDFGVAILDMNNIKPNTKNSNKNNANQRI